ncbi:MULTISPECIES: hypothetical protein [Microbacterium]|uniref:Uncharacterized protein n=1 Tax=Microbacterium maritypicum TaxID=33918 RepID=A0AAJ6AQ22_MICMQ|nr:MULTISPECIES: hypothetical protein [Microbacterium]EYT60365.1 hypothetical protein D514_0105055 [Microbacterium sp. UCD-TDU]WEF20695.1 hypothetical protein PWF71_15595 [Microbacterium liquefaciens]
MTEPQVWTLIGVFAAGMFGTITLISTMFLRTMQNGFDGVRTEMQNEFASVRTEMRNEFASVRTEMRSEFANVRTEIGAVHGRIGHLDRDVNAIYRHLFGIDRG